MKGSGEIQKIRTYLDALNKLSDGMQWNYDKQLSKNKIKSKGMSPTFSGTKKIIITL